MRFFNNIFCSKIKCAFPTPKYLTFDTVGLDISSDAIRLMKLKNSSHGLIPDVYREIKYQNQINFTEANFDISNCEEVIKILNNLKSDLKIKHVVASLPETDTYIYRTEFPIEALSDIASAIRFSLEDNVPLPASDVNFDYFIVDGNKKDKTDVVVSVFPKKIIQSYTRLLDKVGLVPISFQSESVALAESVLNKSDKNPYLLARFLSNKTNVSIVEDGIIQYTSEIWVGSNDLVGELTGDKIENLKTELTKLLIFWFTNSQNNFIHKKIEKAFFVGEKSTEQNIIDFFEKHLKINVDTGNVWTNCFDLNNYVPEIDQKTALNYSVAIGLALKSIKYA